MTKVLLLPFLQMPSGHHQVADAISDYLREIDAAAEIRKVDIFQYTSRVAEQCTTSLYLKAIKLAPSLYSRIYQYNACSPEKADKRFFFYEGLFLNSMKKLIRNESPDLIVCTHGLPSYLLNLMKKNGLLTVPVVNAYTDYFINNVWGISHVDLHLAPSKEIKEELRQRGVSAERIAVTGIPVHPKITGGRSVRERKNSIQVLVSGGHLGVGPIERLFNVVGLSGKITYLVLCGKNRALYEKIAGMGSPYLRPVPYLALRSEMNALYDQVDLVLSKPGGVTISECLRKQVPLCLLEALPGQEEKNQDYLLGSRLAMQMATEELEEQLLGFLENEDERRAMEERLGRYCGELEDVNRFLKKILLGN